MTVNKVDFQKVEGEAASTHQQQNANVQDRKKSERQLSGLANLLLLQSRFRAATSLEELAFIAVNDSRLLTNFNFSAFWLKRPGDTSTSGALTAISDVPEIDAATPFAEWIKDLIAIMLVLETRSVKTWSKEQFSKEIYNENSNTPQNVANTWSEHANDYLLWVPINQNGELLGGVVFFRKTQWSDAEKRVMEHWQDGLSHAVLSLFSRPWFNRRKILNQSRTKLTFAIASFVIFLLFIPVRLTVLAPAKVIPVNPTIVRATLNGAIESVHIEPNSQVNTGDLLISLDKTAVATQHEVANQSLSIINAELRQAQQSAFNDPKAKSLLPILKLKQQRAQLELSYIEQLLFRSDIQAEQTGTVIFSNKNDLIGKPIQLGERLMLIADPSQVQIEIQLPVGDDIQLKKGNQVRLFLSVAPEKPIEATLLTQSYEAVQHDGHITYRLTAEVLEEAASSLRIGQRGTARISGEKVRLGFYLFRRPISYLRESTGW